MPDVPFTDEGSPYAARSYAFKGERNLHAVHAKEWCDGTTTHPPLTTDGDITVLFEGQREALIKLIQKSHTVVGCVAWLTDMSILGALRGKRVCIVVQKEDFLRPDLDVGPAHIKENNKKLRAAYEALGNRGIHRQSLRPSFSLNGDDEYEPGILCAGLSGDKTKRSWPRMHHKFLLFDWNGASDSGGTFGEETEEGYGRIEPNAVFTGSYNITKNAQLSFENSLIIERPSIVAAYMQEFEHIFGISEPLDWNSEWVNPRYRVGT
jgi:phosphatidylserine/phosphatidylglycerophosphate/cardiolipin synthase-like enzyme